jgi:hypothetical protein
MIKMIDSDLLHEFLENSQQIRDLVDRNLEIIRKADRAEYERAKAYWYAHIVMALSNDHDYLGKNMSTMQESAEVLESKAYGEDEDAE